MQKNHANVKWCRYVDDGFVHCDSEKQAQQKLVKLKEKFEACGLELHLRNPKFGIAKMVQEKVSTRTSVLTF